MMIEVRSLRNAMVAVLVASGGYMLFSKPLDAAPSCYQFNDWREQDPFGPDDKAHTGSIGYDPNTGDPQAEWYLQNSVMAGDHHASFEEGNYTLEVMGHAIAECE